MNRSIIATLIFSFLSSLHGTDLFAVIIIVPDDVESIQEGIESAENGDTVLVQPGIYRENILIENIELVVGSLWLTTGDSSYADSTIIEAGEDGSVVWFAEGCGESILGGFTIRNGTGIIIEDEWNLLYRVGGGIYIDGDAPIIRNCIIRENELHDEYLTHGGGIYVNLAEITIDQCVISNNTLESDDERFCHGGGIYINESVAVIRQSNILNNEFEGIYCARSILTITNCSVSNNSASGIFWWISNPTIRNCRITHNGSVEDGSGLYGYHGRDIALVDSCYIADNSGGRYIGGGIHSDHADMIISNCTIRDNSGYGIRCRRASVVIDGCEIRSYRGSQGPGISFSCCSGRYDVASPVISDCIISGNRNRGGPGGGIYSRSSDPIIIRSLIASNNGETAGGVWLDGGSAQIINCTIPSNSSQPPRCIGCTDNNLIVVNSIVWCPGNNPGIQHVSEDTPRSIVIANSCIKDGLNGIEIVNHGALNWLRGNIEDSPGFIGIGLDQYELSEDSPCIDAGRAFFAWLGDTLVNYSQDEYFGQAPDLGAFETNYQWAEYEELNYPMEFHLYQNYPNPFNNITNISYYVSRGEHVNLALYDEGGRVITTLVDDLVSPGYHSIAWDANNVAGGVYLVLLKSGESTKSVKLVVCR